MDLNKAPSNKPILNKPRFNWTELSGSMGDLGLFIPLVVAVCVSSGMALVPVLIAAGLMNIVTGYIFKQPIPVQPMKAIAAVAIVEGLTSSQIAASGMLIGIILVTLSYSGLINCIADRIPKVLIRGIQLGVGIKLILLACEWILALQWNVSSMFVSNNDDAILNAAIVFDVFHTGFWSLVILVTLLVTMKYRFPTLLIIFLCGCVMLYGQPINTLESQNLVSFDAVLPLLIVPSQQDFAYSFWYAVLPQLPLTLLNSVIAICALSADYFPKQGIKPEKMASSVGWMNIICSPFGGFPMCHGASGLAAQYQFGARTGGSVMMLGVIKICIGLLFGASLVGLLGAYPKSILAPLLVIAGLALCKSTWLERSHLNLVILAATAFGILYVNTLFGFVLGVFCYFIWQRYLKR